MKSTASSKEGNEDMNGKKPTREQRKLISENGLYAADWLVTKNTPTEMHLVHRYGDKKKIIHKGMVR